jgi:hypothetical protein
MDPLEARVEMINGRFDLPKETLEAMDQIRKATETASREIHRAATLVPKYDKGRLIATMDLLQQAKNTACDALILPHAVKK